MRSVLVLTSTFPLNKNSSINPCVKNLILHLSREIKIIVVLPDHPELELSYLKNKNIKFVIFKYFYPRSWQKLTYGSGIIPNLKNNPLLALEVIPFFIAQIKATRKIINSKEINTVWTNWVIPSGLSAAISLYGNKKTKFITYIHGSDAHIQNFFYQKLLSYTVKKSDQVITVSQSLLGKIKKYSKSATVIPQGVITHKQKPLKRKPWILFAGRLIPGKGARETIDAFSRIKNKYPQYQLLIIGQGPQKNFLKNYVAKNKIPRVKFLGSISNDLLLEKMRRSKLLIFLSTLPEGLPNILLEAGANKLPILSSKIDGAKDLISEKTAYLTELNPEKISQKIEFILSNYPRATKKSDTFYRKIQKNFSVSKSANTFLKVIKSL